MKSVVIYYSLKGNCQFVAQYIAEKLGVKELRLEPSVEPPTKGLGMFLKGGSMALKKVVPEIKDLGTDLSEYDTVVICAPVWAGTYPPAVGAMLKKYDLSGKKVALAAASASGKGEKMMDELAAACGGDVVGRLSLANPLRNPEACKAKIDDFVQSLQARG